MCLITTQKTPKVAKRNKVVYKLLQSTLYSPFQHYTYSLNILVRTEIKDSDEWCCFDETDAAWLDQNFPDWKYEKPSELKCIGEGFHSATTKERLQDRLNCGRKIFKCVIPKGGKYFLDATGLCVSDSLIVKEKIMTDYESDLILVDYEDYKDDDLPF